MKINYKISEEIKTVENLARDRCSFEDIMSVSGNSLSKEMILHIVNQINKKQKLGEFNLPEKHYKLIKTLVDKEVDQDRIISFFSTECPQEIVRKVIEKMKFYPHPDAKKYKPQNIIASFNKENQRTMGNPNGCTHFSCCFLANNDTKINDKKILEIISQKDLGIQEGVNGDPLEVIRAFPNLMLVDLEGAPTNDEIVCMGDISAELKKIFDTMFKPEAEIQGCLITTGVETFACRITEDEIQLFDPHGDSTQMEPSCVWVFDIDKKARKSSIENIVKFIIDRSRFIIEQTGQLNLLPVKIN